MPQVQTRIADHDFTIDSVEVERRLRRVMPEPLGEHYVVVGGKRFPPIYVLLAYARAAGIHIDDLVDDEIELKF